MQLDSIANLLYSIQRAGQMALDEQRQMSYFERGYKTDGSVITETDGRVEEYLVQQIAGAYPEANLLAEESTWSYDPERRYTFAIDPIDGTDVFSQGMAGWCVSIGLLNERLLPVAGLVFAPKLELLLFADVGKRATCNGREIDFPTSPEPLSARTNVMVS